MGDATCAGDEEPGDAGKDCTFERSTCQRRHAIFSIRGPSSRPSLHLEKTIKLHAKL